MKHEDQQLPQPLWDFQVTGVEFLIDKGRAILGDEMGIGKTRQAIEAAKKLNARGLIVCPRAALYVWREELLRWDDTLTLDEIVIMNKQPVTRRAFWERARGCHEVVAVKPDSAEEIPVNFRGWVIITYGTLQRDIDHIPRDWHICIFDECHKMRNHKIHPTRARGSQRKQMVSVTAFGAAKKLRQKYLFLLSGTPARRGPQDLWTLFHLINPQLFRSYWKFVNTFCHVEDSQWGGKEIYGVRNKNVLVPLTKSMCIRRRKTEVLPDLPPKIRSEIPIELPHKERKIYDELVEDALTILESGTIVTAPSAAVTVMRLRQFLVCPLLIDPPALEKVINSPMIKRELCGAAINTIVDHAEDLPEPHFVIATPFTSVIPLLVARLRIAGIKNPEIIRGGMTPKQIAERVARFKIQRSVAIISVKVAESYNMETCSTGYMLGYEWDPDTQEQCEDRIWRATSKNTVNWYYIKHINTVDEDVLSVLYNKSYNIHQILGDPKFLLRALKRRT